MIGLCHIKTAHRVAPSQINSRQRSVRFVCCTWIKTKICVIVCQDNYEARFVDIVTFDWIILKVRSLKGRDLVGQGQCS